MVDVFISYPRKERARAERIKAKLEALKLDLFFDLEGIYNRWLDPVRQPEDEERRLADNSSPVDATPSALQTHAEPGAR